MKNKFYSLLILLPIIIILLPSICFSELKTVEGEYCVSYLGSMKDKKELEDFRKTVRRKSVENALFKLITPNSGIYLLDHTWESEFAYKCVSYVISNYLEKVEVVSHTEKRRKICDKVRITLDPEVTKKYLNQGVCEQPGIWRTDIWVWDVEKVLIGIMIDNSRVGKKETEKINIGLIIETKIPDLDGYKKEQLVNEQEKHFFNMSVRNKDQYTLIERRHLNKVLEEQKLSSSGITESDTVKLGKILNLDIIVLRLIYANSKVTKVLKVDTGEILLFETYETKKETKKEGWISYVETDHGEWYYDNSSIMKVSPNIIRVWSKLIYSKGWIERNKDFIQQKKELELLKLSKGDYNKLHDTVTLYEIDCLKNKWKTMRFLDYSDDGEILLDYNLYDIFPQTDLIIPDTIGDVIRRKVCK